MRPQRSVVHYVYFTWTLKQLGALYLKEAHAFIERRVEEGTSPFFLYYAPNANHNQRNLNGVFAPIDERGYK